MQAEIHDLVQGSPAWAQFRLDHDGASEITAVLGLSPKVTRNELLHMKSTGLPKEFSDWMQENILDHGHAVEALARPIAERIIGDELYPVTCSLGRLSASCDGLTMSERVAFEHKQWNAALAAQVAAGTMPEQHMPQCQQVLMVTEAEELIFMISDGTEKNMVWMKVYPDQVWFERIRAGWDQFNADRTNYQPRQLAEKPEPAAILALPALVVQTRGEVVSSNLPAFKAAADKFIANIKTELETDEDFADAEATVKFCGEAESNLELAKSSAIAQTASIDEVLRTVDQIKEQLRGKRLMLEKLVAKRKLEIKETILSDGKRMYAEHVAMLEKEIAPLRLPLAQPDFAGAMKNKRTLTSLHDAVDTLLANSKIAASATAADYRAKQAWCKENAAGHGALFMDMAQIIAKPMDDFQLVVTTRVEAHKQAEAKKEADLRARIAAEEKAKAEAAAAETARLAKVEADKAAEATAKAERERVAADTKRQLEDQAKAIAAARAAEQPAAAAAIPASAAPEIARTANFYNEAPIRRAAPTPVPAPTALFDATDDRADIDLLHEIAAALDMTLADTIDRLSKIDFATARAQLPLAA